MQGKCSAEKKDMVPGEMREEEKDQKDKAK